MLAANVPLAVASKRLGHSSAAFTADTYSHLLEGVGRAAAEATAALIPRHPVAAAYGPVAQPLPDGPESEGPESVRDRESGVSPAVMLGGPHGNRTRNPRIKRSLRGLL